MSGDRDHETRSYYEAEALNRSRPALQGRRLELREAFVQQLGAEGRSSVLDVGAGPGRAVEGFVAGGIRYVGCDLAVGNAILGAEIGATVVPADGLSLPFRDASFEAGWCMSVFMHFDADVMSLAVAEFVRVLAPGSPLVIGLWGARGVDHRVDDTTIAGERRPFYHRDVESNRAILSANAAVDDVEIYSPNPGEYQVFWLRAGEPASA